MKENESINNKWMQYEDVQKFFNYRPTQMAELLKNPILKVAKIGKRKFVFTESINKLLEAQSN